MKPNWALYFTFIMIRLMGKKAAIGFTYEESTPADDDKDEERGLFDSDSESSSSLSDIDIGMLKWIDTLLMSVLFRSTVIPFLVLQTKNITGLRFVSHSCGLLMWYNPQPSNIFRIAWTKRG